MSHTPSVVGGFTFQLTDEQVRLRRKSDFNTLNLTFEMLRHTGLSQFSILNAVQEFDAGVQKKFVSFEPRHLHINTSVWCLPAGSY